MSTERRDRQADVTTIFSDRTLSLPSVSERLRTTLQSVNTDKEVLYITPIIIGVFDRGLALRNGEFMERDLWQLMLDKCVYSDYPNSHSVHPLAALAVQNAPNDVMDLFIKHEELTLSRAVKERMHSRVLERILAGDPSGITHKDKQGRTLLHTDFSVWEPSIVVDARTPLTAPWELLAEHGVNPNERDNQGVTAFFAQLRHIKEGTLFNSTRIIKDLLAYGADPTIPDKEGNRPLQWFLKHSAAIVPMVRPEARYDYNAIKESTHDTVLARHICAYMIMCGAEVGRDEIEALSHVKAYRNIQELQHGVVPPTTFTNEPYIYDTITVGKEARALLKLSVQHDDIRRAIRKYDGDRVEAVLLSGFRIGEKAEGEEFGETSNLFEPMLINGQFTETTRKALAVVSGFLNLPGSLAKFPPHKENGHGRPVVVSPKPAANPRPPAVAIPAPPDIDQLLLCFDEGPGTTNRQNGDSKGRWQDKVLTKRAAEGPLVPDNSNDSGSHSNGWGGVAKRQRQNPSFNAYNDPLTSSYFHK